MRFSLFVYVVFFFLFNSIKLITRKDPRQTVKLE